MPDISLEEVLPHNLEAERAILGVILLDEKAIHAAFTELDPREFYLGAHQKIFKAMGVMEAAGVSIDPVTLNEELRRSGELEAVGGPSFVASLTNGLPRALNIEHYARIVRDKATQRRLIQIASEVTTRAYQDEERPSAIIEALESQLFALAAREIKNGFHRASELTSVAFEEIEQAGIKKTAITGLATGFADLDRMIGGLNPSDLIIIAARPGLGKTSLCLNISAHAAIRLKKSVAIFSLEMSKTALVKRLISSESRVDAHKIRTGFLNKEEWRRITRATGDIDQAPIFIDDSANLTLMQIRAKAQRLALEHQMGLLIVDYLQLILGSGRRYENRTQEITEISRGLKNLAKELNIPVIAVSQLNRDVEKRAGSRKPQLSDLRESGALEQDADVVLLISRDEIRNPTEENAGLAEITIAKQRNGPTGTIQLSFIKQYTRFEDLYSEPELNYG